MATFEELRDELRSAECDERDSDFRVMIWTASPDSTKKCHERVESLKRAVCEALERDPDCPILAQRALIVRYAQRNGFDPDVCAEKWIAHNSRKFREAWDDWKRNLAQIERTLPLKDMKRG